MKDKYNNFKNLLSNLLVHLGIDNKCILKENSILIDLDQLYSKTDYFIDFNDSKSFIFKGDFTYLIQKVKHLLKNSDVSFASLTYDKHLLISQLVDQILNSINVQELVRSWTMKISKEFCEIYEEHNLRNVLNFNKNEFKILELETESWITQIKKLLNYKNNLKCLLDEKVFWYQFNENLKILECFFESNQFKFLYRTTIEYNMLIAKSTFDTVQNLTKYKRISNLFNEYYDKLDLDLLYQSNNIKNYQEMYSKIIEIIIRSYDKQQILIKNSIKNNLNGLIEQTLKILKDSDLQNDHFYIRNVITDSYRLFHSIFDLDKNDYLFERLSDYNAYCTEYEHCFLMKKILNEFLKVEIKGKTEDHKNDLKGTENNNYLIDKMNKDKINLKEYEDYLVKNYKKLFKNFIKFEQACLNSLIFLFKEIWTNKTLINKLSKNVIYLGTCSLIENLEFENNFNILNLFEHFFDFELFRKETIVERTSLLDHFYRSLIIFSHNLNYDEVDLSNELGLYLGFVFNLDKIFDLIFNNDEHLVMIDTLKEKTKMIEETLHLRLNLQFEKFYNGLIKRNFTEIELLTIKENCLNVLDSFDFLDLTEIYLEIDYYKILIEILENIPKSKTGESFVKSIQNSRFYVLLMEELRPYFEFRENYFKYYDSFKKLKNILSKREVRVELFKEEIENVFDEIRKFYNLKIKYLLISENTFEKAVEKLSLKYTEFVILTTRLNLHKNFKGKFTFNPEEHCLGIGHPNTFFFRTCIKASYDILVSNYFKTVIDRISNGKIYREINISKEECPDLAIYFELFDEIFPKQDDTPFFDSLNNFVNVNPHLINEIENIIDTVIENYKKAREDLDFLYNHVEGKSLIKKIEIYKEKTKILAKINKNEYPLYKFTSSLDTVRYTNIIENLTQTLIDKQNKRILKLLKKSKGFLTNFSQNALVENPLICGGFLNFYLKIFKKSFKKIKKAKIEKVDNKFIEIEEFNLKFKTIFKEIMDKKELILNNVTKELNINFNQLNLLKENELFTFKDLEENENTFNLLDEILIFFNEPEIDRSLIFIHKKFLEDKEIILKIQNEWNQFKMTTISKLDFDKLNSFIKNLDNLNLEQHEELNYILMKRDLIQLMPNLLKNFVTQEYFDPEIHLVDFLLDFSVDRVNKILHDSEMSHKTLKAISKIKNSIQDISFNFDKTILNFEDVENKLFGVIAECNALENYVKLDKFIPEVKKLTEIVYSMIRINTKLREVQDINVDLKRIITGDVFKLIKDKFDKLNLEILNLIDSLKENQNYPLKNLLNKEEIIENLKTKSIELQFYVKTTIISFREAVHRFYFVSDEDILNLLCGRLTYSEILIQMYNIDEVIIEDNFVKSFKSKNEIVILSKFIDLSLEVKDFFIVFSKSLNETLTTYLKSKIKDVKGDLKGEDRKECYSDSKGDLKGEDRKECYVDSKGNFNNNDKYDKSIKKFCSEFLPSSLNSKISVLDDFLNEFYYFNRFSFEKTTKINFLDKINDQWKGDVSRLYPKPVISYGKLIIKDITINDVFMEYYPPSDIVFTNLTSNIFSMISLGLSKTAGIILFGKSGTGKTETVKYYCRTILRPVYVFCCSEECDISTLENIITGCIKMGSYLCLDEFNRLKKNTMSSVTELIFKNKEDVKFFLTMNLGYSGRNELPKSLRSIFTEIRVDNPDIKDIVDIFFEKYSTKIMRFLPKLEKNCEKLDHYNFGLRAIKTIIGTKIDLKHFKNLFNFEVEDHLILYAFFIFYHATLSKNDKKILKDIFYEIFDIKITNPISYQDTFNFGIESSTGLLIYGKERSGKSFLIKEQSKLKNIKIEYYNPPNTQNFFGYYDEITGEWIDGSFITSLKNNKDKEIWYVFDCILNSNWIENFNSVLDENRSLCLKSGEILKIGSKSKFIFESCDLKEITPATMTRIFTIYIDDLNYNMDYHVDNGDMDYHEDLVCYNGDYSNRDYDLNNGNLNNNGNLDNNVLKPQLFSKNHLNDNSNSLPSTSSCFKFNFTFDKVTFLTGHGKFDFLFNLLGDKLTIVDPNDNIFLDLFTKDDLVIRNNQKIFVKDLILYIESFDKASQKLQEIVREYAQYDKIGDVILSKLKLICGYDKNEIHKRLRHKGLIINCKNEDLPLKLSKNLNENLHKLLDFLKTSKQLEKFNRSIIQMNEKGFMKYHDIFKMLKVLNSILNLEEPFLNIFYFVTKIFSLKDTKSILSEIWNKEPKEDYEVKKYYNYDLQGERSVDNPIDQPPKDHQNFITSNNCIQNLIILFLNLNFPLIVLGPKLSSKRFLIDKCIKRIKTEINIYNFYDEIKFDPKGVYLIDKLEKIPKSILRKSVVINLDLPKYLILDYETIYAKEHKVYGMYLAEKVEKDRKYDGCEDSCDDRNDDTGDDMKEDGRKEDLGDDNNNDNNNNHFDHHINLLTRSCSCCGLNIPKSNRFYSKDKVVFKENLLKRNPGYQIVNINDLFSFELENKKIFILFDSLFKYRDFIKTFHKMHKQSLEKYEKRKLQIQEGFKTITNFKEQASNLLNESLKKKNQLEILKNKVKIKMDKMVEIQIQMKIEKERIFHKQNELDLIFKESLKKKNIIDIKMKDIIPLLNESKNKISKISKKHLAEIKTMVKPPEIIKFVIELVYTMLEEERDLNINWGFLMQYVRKEDFMSKIINFKGISKKNMKEMGIKIVGSRGGEGKGDSCKGGAKVNGDNGMDNKGGSKVDGDNGKVNGKDNIKVHNDGEDKDDNTSSIPLPSTNPSPTNITLKSAYKASFACGILYEWILANFEYKKVHLEVKPLLDETEEIKKKIEDLEKQIKEEEIKYKDLENEIEFSKEEYTKSSFDLEEIKKETKEIEDKQFKINFTLNLIHNEIEKWDLKEPGDVLKIMINKKEWYFKEKKNIFIPKKQGITDLRDDGLDGGGLEVNSLDGNIPGINSLDGNAPVGLNPLGIPPLNNPPKELTPKDLSTSLPSFLKTSPNHKNFLQVLNNAQVYNSNLLIFDVDEFLIPIYKILKYQLLTKSFSIILISNFDFNFYSECTYNYEIIKKFNLNFNLNLRKHEEDLLNSILKKDLEEICKFKKILDLKREEYKDLESKRNYYLNLNKIYSKLDLKYKKYYKFGLSFEVFRSYIKRSDWGKCKGEGKEEGGSEGCVKEEEGSEGCVKEEGGSGNKDCKDSKDNGHKDIIENNTKPNLNPLINIFNLGLPINLNPIDIKNEFINSKNDLTIISTSGDIIYEIEMNIKIKDTISAGSIKNNKKIIEILQGGCGEDEEGFGKGEEEGEGGFKGDGQVKGKDEGDKEGQRQKDHNVNHNQNVYLIKNINLLDKNALRSPNPKKRFIFVSEEIVDHNLIYNTRILYNPKEIEIEKIKNKYLKIFKEEKESIEYHCELLKEKEVNFNDLLLIIKSKGECSKEYLRYLIYEKKYV